MADTWALATSLKNEGNGFFKQKNYDAAIASYTKSVQADSKFHVSYSNRSQAYFLQGKYQQAADDGQLCINAKSDWPKGYHRRANALNKLYETTKKDSALVACWTTLKQAAAAVGHGNSDLANLHAVVRPRYEAYAARAEAALQGPERTKAEGNTFFKASEYMKAVKKYQQAVSQCGDRAEHKYLKAVCLNNQANCFKQQSNFKQMLEVCMEAQDLLDKYDQKECKILVKVWYNLAEAYKGVDKWKLAKDTIMKVILIHPNWDPANKMKNQINAAIQNEKKYKTKQ